MTQQTAVEWLFMTLALTPMTEWYNVLEKAKSIEKEQIENAFNYGNNNKWGSESQINNGEDYYNEKYIK
jgi:hypothetical protein